MTKIMFEKDKNDGKAFLPKYTHMLTYTNTYTHMPHTHTQKTLKIYIIALELTYKSMNKNRF